MDGGDISYVLKYYIPQIPTTLVAMVMGITNGYLYPERSRAVYIYIPW